jgi:type II secretion system protein I
MSQNKGFALLEVLVALTIFSIISLSIYSSVSNGAVGILRSRNIIRAGVIASNLMNDFRLEKSKLDLDERAVPDNDQFTYSRTITRYENPLLGPIPASKVAITVFWKENGIARNYALSYIYLDK